MTATERRNGGRPNALVRRPKPYFLTVREVAAALRVSKMTVYREIDRGELQAVMVGYSYRVFESSLSSYVRRHHRSLHPAFRFGGKGF